MKYINKLIFLIVTTLSLANAQSPSFVDAPEVLGELPNDTINESSGIAYDHNSGLVFHINDSGDGPYIYTTKRDATEVIRWSYDDKDPKDVEDLAIGPCSAEGQERCLYVADMGDNRRKRSHIRITQIELSEFDESLKRGSYEVKPREIFKLEYPDNAHDAESLIVTEQAKIYILTKEWSETYKKVYPSKLFVFDPANPLAKKEELQYVTSVDFRAIIPNMPWWGQTPTAMDYSPTRKEVSILTYSSILVMSWEDLLAGGQRHQNVLHLIGPELPQQEAITYSPEGLIYSTEFVEDSGPANLYLWRYR